MQTVNSTEQSTESIVNALVLNSGIKWHCQYIGFNTSEDIPSMDAWNITLSSENTKQLFSYYSGIGHRAPATALQKREAERGFQGLTLNDRKGLTSYGKRYLKAVEDLRKPIAPSIVNILYCLMLDAEAANQTFNDWCSSYGYDSDSIEALGIYSQCQKTADKLNKLFSSKVKEALSDALQDY